MRRKFILTTVLTLSIVSCGNEGGSNSYIYSEPKQVKPTSTNWLLLIYMDGDNNLSDYTYSDIQEIQQLKLNNTIKVAVLQDTLGNNGAFLYETDENGNLKQIKSLPEPNMGDPTTLENFVLNEVKKYPAKNIALILWDHGNGWRALNKESLTKMVALDETNNEDQLFMFEFKEALEKLQEEGIKISLIGFDECLMGNLESFYDIANYTQYIVASEHLEPATGWNYTLVLNKLNQNPNASPEEIAHYIVDAYREAYSNLSQPLTMLAIPSKTVEKLVEAVNDIANTYLSNPSKYHDEYLNAVPDEIPQSNNLVDLYTFAVNLNSEANINGTQQVIKTINGLYKYTNDNKFQGISIYLPTNQQDVEMNYFCTPNSGCLTPQGEIYYNPFTATLWDDFLKVFLGLK